MKKYMALALVLSLSIAWDNSPKKVLWMYQASTPPSNRVMISSAM